MSQPFMYIFALLVIGFILVFGFLQVRKVLDFGKDVEEVKFENDLQKIVDRVYSLSPGSSTLVDKKDLLLPSTLDGLCFVDATNPIALSQIPFDSLREDLRLLGSSSKNIFYVVHAGEDALPASKIVHLETDGVVCFDFRLRKDFSFVLENRGDLVVLRNYEP